MKDVYLILIFFLRSLQNVLEYRQATCKFALSHSIILVDFLLDFSALGA